MNAGNIVYDSKGKITAARSVGGTRILESSSMIKKSDGSAVTTGCSNVNEVNNMQMETSRYNATTGEHI